MRKLFWFNNIIAITIILFFTTECKKEQIISLPVFSKISLNYIAKTYAESKSKIVSDEGEIVRTCGVCWLISGMPTNSDSKTPDSTGVVSFASKITKPRTS